MAKIKVRRNIEIERNVIEKFLMGVREYIRANRKKVQYSLLGFLLLCVLFLAGFLKLSGSKKEQLIKFENILGNYHNIQKTDREIRKKTIDELKLLTESSYSGFVNEISYYVIGNLHFSGKEYKESITYLLKYAEISSSPMLSSIALLKAAVASEESNDLERAIQIYKQLEKDHGNSVVADQIYYNMGRIYKKNKEISESRKYYNKVISSFPNSLFAEKAMNRLFFTGLEK